MNRWCERADRRLFSAHNVRSELMPFDLVMCFVSDSNVIIKHAQAHTSDTSWKTIRSLPHSWALHKRPLRVIQFTAICFRCWSEMKWHVIQSALIRGRHHFGLSALSNHSAAGRREWSMKIKAPIDGSKTKHFLIIYCLRFDSLTRNGVNGKQFGDIGLFKDENCAKIEQLSWNLSKSAER